MKRWLAAAWLGVALLCGQVCWGQDEGASGAASARPDPAAAKQAFTDTMEQARKLESAADGVALWEGFISSNAGSPLVEPAQKELASWKQRADQNLARFGQAWLPKAEVDKRNAKADELLGQAEGAGDPAGAIKLFNEAAMAHPYRSDIHFRKFVYLYKNGREKEAPGALSGILKGDPQNVVALNNMGVLAARQGQWDQALGLLLRAVGQTDQDAVWDNVDQVMAMADEAGHPTASAEGQLRGQVARLQRSGKHVGETRWGNSWISQSDYDSYVKENRGSADKLRTARNKVRAAEARRKELARGLDRASQSKTKKSRAQEEQARRLKEELKQVDDAAEKFKKDYEAAKQGVREPAHAEKLVLLNLDGSEMESVEPKLQAPEEAGKDGEGKTKGKKKEEGGGLFD